MPAVPVDGLTFHFPSGWEAAKYDDWQFFTKTFQRISPGTKAIDLVAVSPPPEPCFWVVEVKNYNGPRSKPGSLVQDVAQKVRDGLAGLAAARVMASVLREHRLAGLALWSPKLRVVLHLEQPPASGLFRRAFDPAKVELGLQQLLLGVDPRARVVESADMRGVPWTVT